MFLLTSQVSRDEANLVTMNIMIVDEPSLNLKEYVRLLENKNNPGRGQYIQTALEELGLKTTNQVCRRPLIKNIIVDFSPDSERQFLFSAHYDAVRGSPGANDNASGVAVLLGLCHKLKNRRGSGEGSFF